MNLITRSCCVDEDHFSFIIFWNRESRHFISLFITAVLTSSTWMSSSLDSVTCPGVPAMHGSSPPIARLPVVPSVVPCTGYAPSRLAPSPHAWIASSEPSAPRPTNTAPIQLVYDVLPTQHRYNSYATSYKHRTDTTHTGRPTNTAPIQLVCILVQGQCMNYSHGMPFYENIQRFKNLAKTTHTINIIESGKNVLFLWIEKILIRRL